MSGGFLLWRGSWTCRRRRCIPGSGEAGSQLAGQTVAVGPSGPTPRNSNGFANSAAFHPATTREDTGLSRGSPKQSTERTRNMEKPTPQQRHEAMYVGSVGGELSSSSKSASLSPTCGSSRRRTLTSLKDLSGPACWRSLSEGSCSTQRFGTPASTPHRSSLPI